MRISDLHKRVIAQQTPLILDSISDSVGAYSLRKLRNSYNGACIRVRRSSDNAEQDIGFVNNQLDTASLLSFVGSGSGFVKTWYDQSSLGGNNAFQNTNNNQPRIVNNGVYLINNLDGGLNFFQETHAIELPNITFNLPIFSFSFLLNYNSVQSRGFPRIIAGTNISTNTVADHEIPSVLDSGAVYNYRFRWGGNLINSSSNYMSLNNIAIYHVVYSSPNLNFYKNGVLFQSLNFNQTGAISFYMLMNRITLGTRLNGILYRAILFQKFLSQSEVLEDFNSIKNIYNL